MQTKNLSETRSRIGFNLVNETNLGGEQARQVDLGDHFVGALVAGAVLAAAAVAVLVVAHQVPNLFYCFFFQNDSNDVSDGFIDPNSKTFDNRTTLFVASMRSQRLETGHETWLLFISGKGDTTWPVAT